MARSRHPRGFVLKDIHVAINKKAAGRIKRYLLKTHKKTVKSKRYKVVVKKHRSMGRTGYSITELVKPGKR